MDERGLCVWNGEWGPVYARTQYDGEATDSINTVRYQVLKDQLEIYNSVSPQNYPSIVVANIHYSGSSELVYLAVQGHRLPGHGVHLPRDSLHDPLQGLFSQETALGR